MDAVVDVGDPLPASSLKGVMRAAALEVMRAEGALVSRVFGSEFAESPWVWSSAQPGGGQWPAPSVRARVSIDEQSHTVIEDRLMLAEVLEPTQPATFAITNRALVPEKEHDTHVALLRCAAAAVRHIGSQRRRGLGWVKIRDGEDITPEDIRRIRDWRSANA